MDQKKLARWHAGLLILLGTASLVLGVCSIAGAEMDHRLRICIAVIQIAAGLGLIYTTVQTLRNRT